MTGPWHTEPLPRPAVGSADRDRRLLAAAGRALEGSGYPLLGSVRLHVEAGVVVLYGRLPSYYLRQVAQARVAAIEGVRAVEDHVRVVRRGRPKPAQRRRNELTRAYNSSHH